MGRLRVGLLRGDSELREAEKKDLRSFSSIPAGLCAAGWEGDGMCEGETGQKKKDKDNGTLCFSPVGSPSAEQTGLHTSFYSAPRPVVKVIREKSALS